MLGSYLTHKICLACLTYLIKWHFTSISFKPYAYKHISCCGLVVYFLWLSWSFVILKYVFVDWNKSTLWTLIRGECSKKPLPWNGSDPCANIEKPKLERKGHGPTHRQGNPRVWCTPRNNKLAKKGSVGPPKIRFWSPYFLRSMKMMM